MDHPDFIADFAELSESATSFAAERATRIYEHLAAIDALLADLRAVGIDVTVHRPFEVHSYFADHRFDFALSRALHPFAKGNPHGL